MRARNRCASRLLRLAALVLLSSVASLASAESGDGTSEIEWICKALNCVAESVTHP